MEEAGQTAAGGDHQGSGIGDHFVGGPLAVELDAVELGGAGGEQVLIPQRNGDLALEALDALPSAEHRADHVQTLLQDGHGTGDGNEIAGGHSHQQTGGEDLNGQGDVTVPHAGEDGDAAAQEQGHEAEDALGQLRTGGLVVVIHEVRHLAVGTQDTGAAAEVVRLLYHPVETDGLPEGIHLGHLGGVAVETAHHGQGHLQAESGAAGDPQILQAEDCVGAAGGEGQGQDGADGEAESQQIPQSVQQLTAAQPCGKEHGQHLAEDHQTQAVVGDHIQYLHGGDGAAEQHDQDIDEDAGLDTADAVLIQLIVALFGAGDQSLLQLPQAQLGIDLDHSGLRLRHDFLGLGGGGHVGELLQPEGILLFGFLPQILRGDLMDQGIPGHGALGFGQRLLRQGLLRKLLGQSLESFLGILVEFVQDVVQIEFLEVFAFVHGLPP